MSTKTRRGAVEQITSSSEEETSNSIEIEKTSLENQASIDVFAPSKEFLALLKKMKNAPYQFESASALMQELSIAIQEGLGLQRCAIMLFNKEKSRVKTYFASGIEKSDPLHTFEAQLIKGTIFKVLSDKPAGLWVKPSTRREVSDLVPMNFKQVTQRDEQLFASVFSGKQALALIYADTELKTPIREEQFRYFKLATKALETAIVAISSKPKS